MVVKQKPPPKVVKKSAQELPKKGVSKVEKSEDARIESDQKNAPNPNKGGGKGKPKGKK
ncbi:MAG TPA: hypothetical protein VGH86_11210 [Phenylobacterium sp.]|jgi:hypothetical protein